MIIGLDVSLRACAACCIYTGHSEHGTRWPYSLDGVFTHVAGQSLEADASSKRRVERIQFITNDLIAWVRECIPHEKFNGVFIEDYAFGAMGAHVRSVAELTGVIKWRFFDELAVIIEPINMARARKILLQKVPRKDAKKFVSANVKRVCGKASTWTDDEIDAFVISNAGVMLTGDIAMTFEGQHGLVQARKKK